jgi:hypothetical protein
MRWNRQPNVDLKSDSVAVVVTWSDHLHSATCDPLVMSLKSLYFEQYLVAGGI